MTSLFRHQVVTFSLVWLAYCSTYFVRKPLGVVKADLGEELEASISALGWCDTALLLPYAVVQILFPNLADSLGPRRVLASCLGLGSLSTVLTYRAPDLLSFSLGLGVTGSVLAPAWPACTKLLAAWFEDTRLNTMFGLVNTCTYCGGLGGTALAAALLEYSGWRSVGVPPAVFAAIAGVLVYLCLATPEERGVIVPGKGQPTPTAKVPPPDNTPESRRSLAALLTLPSVPELCVAMFCLKFVRFCIYMWLPLYLLDYLHYTKLQAGLFATMFDVGGILGSPSLGLLLDKTFSSAPLTGVTLVMVTGTTFLAIFTATASWGLLANLCCLLVVGAANCGPDSILGGSISMEVGERVARGSGAGVTSLVNGVGSLGGMVEGPLVGLVWSVTGWRGVLPLLVVVSGIGTTAIYRADRTQTKDNILPA